MPSLSRHLKALVASGAAIAALVAVAASPAMAEEVPAQFSGKSIKLTTSGVTVKRNGGDAKSCTLKNGSTGGPIEFGNWAWIYNTTSSPPYRTIFNCTGGTTFVMWLSVEAFYDDEAKKYILRATGDPATDPYTSPWGSYIQGGFVEEPVGTWVNGSGGTNSTLTYQEEETGYLPPSGDIVTLTGTFTATTGTGTLLTLSH